MILVLAACGSDDPVDEPAAGATTSTISSPSSTAAATTTTTDDGTVTTGTAIAADGTTTTEAGPRPVSVFDLAVGSCFDRLDEGSETDVVLAVRCDTPHQAEVYGVFEHPAPELEPYPGRRALEDQADERCLSSFEVFVGREYATSELDILRLYPLQIPWELGDRLITCAVVDIDGEALVGSMRGSRR